MINIETLIKESGISKADLADKLGVSRTALYSILNGNPTVKSLEKIAEIIGCDMADFFPKKTKETATHKCPKCGARLSLSITEEK